jgi:hypothetical protein
VRSGAIVLTGVYPVCPRLKCASGSVVAKVTIEVYQYGGKRTDQTFRISNLDPMRPSHTNEPPPSRTLMGLWGPTAWENECCRAQWLGIGVPHGTVSSHVWSFSMTNPTNDTFKYDRMSPQIFKTPTKECSCASPTVRLHRVRPMSGVCQPCHGTHPEPAIPASRSNSNKQ